MSHEAPATGLSAILDMVAARRGLDFHDYCPPTIARGIRDRMARIACPTPEGYLAALAGDPEEVDRLVEALVVPVTSFFRDPPVFASLASTVLPGLARAARPRGLLRAWVAGTSTGEEAWTVAMLLAEVCEEGPHFEVVASDLDARSVVSAAAGRYPLARAEAIPRPLRDRYLAVDGPEVVVARPLRERVHFDQHDIMGPRIAPPSAVVAAFDLVCLRNVLIYFDRRLQRKALERVLPILEPGGALVLGALETLPTQVERGLETWPGTEPRLRIFRRREG